MNLQFILSQGFKIQSLSKIQDGGWYAKFYGVNPANGMDVYSIINFDDDFNVHSENPFLPSIITEEDGGVFFEWYNHGVFVKLGSYPERKELQCNDNKSSCPSCPTCFADLDDWNEKERDCQNCGYVIDSDLYYSLCEEKSHQSEHRGTFANYDPL